jgi:hypothetical protein
MWHLTSTCWACVGAATQPCCHDKASLVPDQRALHPLTFQTWTLCMKLVLMLLCLACCPVRCRVVAYLPGKAREPRASQGNQRTVRWPRGSTTTCSYCCTGRLSCWTLWSKSSEFMSARLLQDSPQAVPCCITQPVDMPYCSLQFACSAAPCQ